jgi:hypothetical protein
LSARTDGAKPAEKKKKQEIVVNLFLTILLLQLLVDLMSAQTVKNLALRQPKGLINFC